MPIDPTICLPLDALQHRITRQSRSEAIWMQAYAASVNATDVACFDNRVPGGPRMHPLFPVCYEWPAWAALNHYLIPEDVLKHGVHCRQSMMLHRPVQADELLTTEARLVCARATRSGVRLLVELKTRGADGQPVTTTHSELAVQGVTIAATVGHDDALVRLPMVADEQAAEWSESLSIAPGYASAYTACARIENPIHTDGRVAAAAGFDYPLLHGTATLALAISTMCDRSLPITGVHRIMAVFRAAVIPPAVLSVESLGTVQGMHTFRVHDGAGQVVLSGALA